MKHILLRGTKGPFDVASPRETLERNLVATNSGNLVFLEAAAKILSTRDTVVVADRLEVNPRRAAEINDRFDAYVIPLANAFKWTFEGTLIRMTQLIERLRIPVVILGVGAQTNLASDFDRLQPMEGTVRRFVSAVLDRSGSIGVRGELTADYLASLGFKEVEVIGCPSMYLHGPNLRVDKRADALERDSRIAINVSPGVKAMGDIVMSHLERYPDLVYVAQDLDTLEWLLWGESGRTAVTSPKLPFHAAHPLFQQGKVRFYTDPWPWIQDLRSFDFAFGTRIHGNIAAILAGTPAFVFAHDSRTLELARYFEIPHRVMRDVPPDVDAADLYAEADYSALIEGHAARFAVFRAYLGRHGLRDIFLDGEDPAAFDRRIAATPFPPAVEVLTGTGEPAVVTAARRLRHRFRRFVRGATIRRIYINLARRTRRGAWTGG